MSLLSREQLEALYFDTNDIVRSSVLTHDAAQRALLRHREEEITEIHQQCHKVGYESVLLLADAFCEVMNERTELRAQLAAMTQERDDAIIRALASKQELDKLYRQLAEAQATIERLEGACDLEVLVRKTALENAQRLKRERDILAQRVTQLEEARE